jgi:plastocyanin
MTTTPHTTTAPDQAPRADAERGWIRLLVWISLLAAAADLGAPALAGGVIPPLAAGAVLTLVGLLLLRRYRRTGIAVLGITSLMLIITGAPFALPNLAHPASPITFLHAIMLIARVGAVVAAVGAWRHARASTARRVGLATAGLFGAAIVVTGIATVLAPSDTAQPRDVAVSVADFAFIPEEVRVTAGGTVFVDNDDLIVHTFSVRDTELSQALHERRSVRLHVDLDPGTYDVFCAVPGHEFMTATLVVE